MERRQFLRRFLGGLAGTAALATFDVDRLLWVPGEKTIFLPSVDTFEDWFTFEALRILEQNLAFASAITRQYDQDFQRAVGSPLVVRLPQRFPSAAGPAGRLRTALDNLQRERNAQDSTIAEALRLRVT